MVERDDDHFDLDDDFVAESNEEEQILDEVARLARAWFLRFLVPAAEPA